MTTLEILIPTFNRSERLIEGLARLSDQIRRLGEPGSVTVAVSDNASTDNTWAALQVFKEHNAEVPMRCHLQASNIGLERNAVGLLERARSDWVMYLADDDLLPDGYLEHVLALSLDDEVTCIVPGNAALSPDGSLSPARGHASDHDSFYEPSWQACAVLATYGHQMSGVCFRREGTVEAYLRRPDLWNLYPFVFFAGFNALRGRGWYVPRMQVHVLEDQDKDWDYDSSHLLRDLLSNFSALLPGRPWERSCCEIYLMWAQPWRLGISLRHPGRSWQGFVELMSSQKVSARTRIALPMVYAATLTRIATGRLATGMAPLRRRGSVLRRGE